MSSALFDLVKSLSQSEKRYFSRFATLHTDSAETAYYNLFQRLASATRYDAKSLQEEFGEKHFEQLKRALYEKLLASLRLYTDRRNKETKIWSHYINSRMLYSRGVVRNAERERILAEQQTAGYEMPALHLHVLNSAMSAQLIHRTDDELAEMNRTYMERVDFLTKSLLNQTRYTALLLDVESLNRRFEGTRDAQEHILINRFLQRKEMKEFPVTADNTVRLSYYFCNGLANYLLCDFHSSARYFESARAVLKSQPHIQEYDVVLSARILANCALSNFHAGEKSKFADSLVDLKNFSAGKGEMQQYTSELVLILELMELNRDKKYPEAIRKFRKVEKGRANDLKNDVMNQQEIYFAFQEVTALRGAGELKKASVRAAAFVNNKGKQLKQDAYMTARIVFLLIRFELDDESLTQSELRSVTAELYRKKKFYRVERALLSFVKDMLTLAALHERKRRRNQLLSELKELKEIPYEKNAFLYFDFQEWAESFDLKS